MSTLPTGTVTFLFADVEGSTRLQQDPRLDYPAIIGAVRTLLRQAVAQHAGQEVDAVGDEFLAAFVDVGAAADAAYAAQRAMRDADWPQGAPVRVRIGIHFGAPDYGEEGYTGLDIVRAARISRWRARVSRR